MSRILPSYQHNDHFILSSLLLHVTGGFGNRPVRQLWWLFVACWLLLTPWPTCQWNVKDGVVSAMKPYRKELMFASKVMSGVLSMLNQHLFAQTSITTVKHFHWKMTKLYPGMQIIESVLNDGALTVSKFCHVQQNCWRRLAIVDVVEAILNANVCAPRRSGNIQLWDAFGISRRG